MGLPLIVPAVDDRCRNRLWFGPWFWGFWGEFDYVAGGLFGESGFDDGGLVVGPYLEYFDEVVEVLVFFADGDIFDVH